MRALATAALSLLLCASTFASNVDSPEGVGSRWVQVLPDPATIPHRNRFKLFHDILVEDDRHSLALLRWHDLTEHHPTRCNVTTETHALDGGRAVQRKSCRVYPPPDDDNKWTFAESVTYLRRDRVLLTWREQHKTQGLRMTSQVIFTDTCRTSEYISVETYSSASLLQLVHWIVRHASTFDVIFTNRKLCPTSYYCKLSFDHDGKQLRRAEPLDDVDDDETLTIVQAYAMSGDGVVLVGKRAELPVVYSPALGWTRADGLFYNDHWYSNSSGFASLCWQLRGSTDFRCKWLDGTHNRRQLLSLSMRRRYVRIAGIHNTPDGRILLLMPGYEDGTTKLFVDEASKDGCRRLAAIPYSHGLIKRVEMSIDGAAERVCFSLVTKKTVSGNSSAYPITDTYQFTTKCSAVDLYAATPEFIDCGRGYL